MHTGVHACTVHHTSPSLTEQYNHIHVCMRASTVKTYPFDDHNAPQFELIGAFCDDLEEYLKQDENNVGIIHCSTGMVSIYYRDIAML